MKTLSDLEKMKNITMFHFESQYDFLFATLEDYYIAKMDGIERIAEELKNWDSAAQKVIVNKLVEVLSEDSIIGFNKNDILSLLE